MLWYRIHPVLSGIFVISRSDILKIQYTDTVFWNLGIRIRYFEKSGIAKFKHHMDPEKFHYNSYVCCYVTTNNVQHALKFVPSKRGHPLLSPHLFVGSLWQLSCWIVTVSDFLMSNTSEFRHFHFLAETKRMEISEK